MNILALDLGTKTGFAYNDGDRLTAGTWVLATEAELKAQRKQRMDRRKDIRVLRLMDRVRYVLDLSFDEPIRFTVFEDVPFVKSRAQAQLWSSFRAAVWLATDKLCDIECVPVTTLKLFAAGHGGADKDRMRKGVLDKLAKCGTISGDELDDNAIDALAAWLWAQNALKRA